MRRVRAWCTTAVAVALAACASPTEPSLPPTPIALGLQSAAWETISDPHPYPLSNEGAALTFEFPAEGSMHYLYTASPQKTVRGTLVVTLRVSTTGPVVFNSLDPGVSNCVIPVSVRPFIWANDNGNGAYDRWWSNPRAFALAAGTTTISVPLTGEFWSSVNGRFGNADSSTQYQFDTALVNVSRFGLTFGGGCSFGHGINVGGGSASFALTEYAVR